MEATVLPELSDNKDTLYQQSAETLDNTTIEMLHNSPVVVRVCCFVLIAVVCTVIYCCVRPNSNDEYELSCSFQRDTLIEELEGSPITKSTVVHFKCPDLDETNRRLKATGEDHMELPENDECFSQTIVTTVMFEASKQSST